MTPCRENRPNTDRFLRHPLIPCERKIEINRNSVPRFPRDRIRDMTSERLVLVKTSGTDRHPFPTAEIISTSPQILFGPSPGIACNFSHVRSV